MTGRSSSRGGVAPWSVQDGYTWRTLHLHMGEAGLDSAALARLCGVTPRAVQLWLSGDREVPVLVRRVVRGIALGRLSPETFDGL